MELLTCRALLCCLGSMCLQPAAQRLCGGPASHPNANPPATCTEPTFKEYQLTSTPNCGCTQFAPNLPLSQRDPCSSSHTQLLPPSHTSFCFFASPSRPCSNLSSSDKLNRIGSFLFLGVYFDCGQIHII